eukprot:m.277458 g.277458  ORF g.277458 m.277458 type:complete len:482 (-) comp17707_c1_seq1:8036-9481(-)
MSYRHGVLSRDAAEALIIDAGANDHSFLIRTSAHDPTTRVLTVCHSGLIEHQAIISTDIGGMIEFALKNSDATFPSVAELVEYYARPTATFPGPLLRPVLAANPSNDVDETPSASIAELTRRNDPPQSAAQMTIADNSDTDDSEDDDDFGMGHDDFAPISRSARATSVNNNPRASPERKLPSAKAAAPAAEARHNPFAAPQPTLPTVAQVTQQRTQQRTPPRSGTVTARKKAPEVTRARAGTLTGLERRGNHIVPAEQYNPHERELLLREGYLNKIRGLSTRKRWFSLTTKRLAYYETNGGKQMAQCPMSDVLTVQDFADSKKFRIHTKQPFGTTVYFEMMLEAPSHEAKAQWLTAFTRKQDDLSGFNAEYAELVIEGPLVKIKPLGQTSKTRWFRLTSKKLGYYAKDGGAHLGSIPLEFVDTIAIIASSKKDFIIRTTQKFTKNGSSEVHCRASSESVRRRWITLLRKTIPTAKFVEMSS